MIKRPSRIEQLIRRGFLLEYTTLLWNVAGGPILLATGMKVDSSGLIGFGLDSLIEIFASVVVIWHLKGTADTRKPIALRLIGAAFCLLAVVILWRSVQGLVFRNQPSQSWLGLAWLAATVLVMLLLALGKAMTGRSLANAVLQTEARVTLVDAALAAVVLIGVLMACSWNIWWADPVAGLLIALYAAREGRNAFAS